MFTRKCDRKAGLGGTTDFGKYPTFLFWYLGSFFFQIFLLGRIYWIFFFEEVQGRTFVEVMETLFKRSRKGEYQKKKILKPERDEETL